MKKYIIEQLSRLVNLRSNFTIKRLNNYIDSSKKKGIPTELISPCKELLTFNPIKI